MPKYYWFQIYVVLLQIYDSTNRMEKTKISTAYETFRILREPDFMKKTLANDNIILFIKDEKLNRKISDDKLQPNIMYIIYWCGSTKYYLKLTGCSQKSEISLYYDKECFHHFPFSILKEMICAANQDYTKQICGDKFSETFICEDLLIETTHWGNGCINSSC